MNLRELIIERILFAADEDSIREHFQMEGDLDEELNTLSDLDLLEMYEEVIVEPI